MTHPVLALQEADSAVDQLRHRRQHLAEREALATTQRALAEWERTRASIIERLAELAATVERCEHESHEIDVHRERLQKQLRTVIAPREAEALQHEIATLEQRRGELDDAGLQALEEQAQLDDDLTALAAREQGLREDVLNAETALAAAESDIDSVLVEATERVEAARAELDAGLLARYDGLRSHDRVAAALLSGTRCEGCHLDLSAHEVEEARAAAADADGLTDCPQCGRLLVVP